MEEPACNLCGSVSREPLFTAKDFELGLSEELFNLVKCKLCGLVYLCPRPNGKEMARFYPAEYYSTVLPVFKGTGERRGRALVKNWVRMHYWGWPGYRDWKKVWGLIQKAVAYPFRHVATGIPYKESARILDVGCGNGRFLKELRSLDSRFELWGLEPGVEAFTDYEEYDIRLIRSTIEESVLGANEYNTITAWDVIEHWMDPLSSVKKIYKALKPGGSFICGTPDVRSVEVKVFKGDAYIVQAPRHLHLFEKRTLELLLRKGGFESVRVVRTLVRSHLEQSYCRNALRDGKELNVVVKTLYGLLDKGHIGTGLRAVALKGE